MSMATETTVRLRPLSDRVILRRDDAESVSEGGIVIPDVAKEIPARGTIVAVGPGKRNDRGEFTPLSVEVGDKVLFAKYAGEKVEHDGEELTMLREADVMAVIEPE